MNNELFALRIEAHKAFDPLWRHGYLTREQAYDLLAVVLDVPPHHCHIAVLSKVRLQRVIDFAEQKLIELRREAKKHAKSLRRAAREAKRVALHTDDDFAQFRRDKRQKRKYKREHLPRG